jgi:hypothetical protein
MSLSLTPTISNNLTPRGQHETTNTLHSVDALRLNHGWLSRLLDVMKPTPIKPMGVSVNDSIPKRILRWLFTAVVMVLFCTFMAVVVIEWMAGCGESYTDANGNVHLNECVFINFPPKE